MKRALTVDGKKPSTYKAELLIGSEDDYREGEAFPNIVWDLLRKLSNPKIGTYNAPYTLKRLTGWMYLTQPHIKDTLDFDKMIEHGTIEIDDSVEELAYRITPKGIEEYGAITERVF